MKLTIILRVKKKEILNGKKGLPRRTFSHKVPLQADDNQTPLGCTCSVHASVFSSAARQLLYFISTVKLAPLQYFHPTSLKYEIKLISQVIISTIIVD